MCRDRFALIVTEQPINMTVKQVALFVSKEAKQNIFLKTALMDNTNKKVKPETFEYNAKVNLFQ